MKMAVVHDYLCGIGGSERVFQYICEEFAEADIFTLCYNPQKTLPYFLNKKINVTWLNKFLQTPNAFRLSFPLATYVMKSLDLSKYDLVLSSSATTAKYVSVPNGKHICYCYIPTRALWQYEEYFKGGLKAAIFKLLVNSLKRKDFAVAQEIDRFIAISDSTKHYIKKYYRCESDVVYSPIEIKNFYSSNERQDYFLIVSRLEYWKRVDYAIEAFNMINLPLKIIGSGAEEKKLRAMAKNNIEFLGEVGDDVLCRAYSECRAVIFTPYIEYGLIPLEANASGTPVICYGKGGVTETMIPSDNIVQKKPTAVFFYKQPPQALMKAIEEFENCEFDASYLIQHASQWSVERFKEQLRNKIQQYG